MIERLAEIEARADELLSHFGPLDSATSAWAPTDVDVLIGRVCDDDIPWLVAQLRASREVVEAWAQWTATETELGDESLDLDDGDYEALWNRSVVELSAARAALAALEAEDDTEEG